MAIDVRKRFLGHPEERGCSRTRAGIGLALVPEADLEPGPLTKSPCKHLKCGGQSFFAHLSWIMKKGKGTHLFFYLLDRQFDLTEKFAECEGDALSLDLGRTQAEHDEQLSGGIVQFLSATEP